VVLAGTTDLLRPLVRMASPDATDCRTFFPDLDDQRVFPDNLGWGAIGPGY
jgi:hypothetical protein